VGPGLAIVRATIDQKFDQVVVTVIPPVASVQVTGRRATLGINVTLQLTATPRDAAGVTLASRPVTWSSSDETKARVSQAGVVTGVSVGDVTISATSEGVSGTIAISIANLAPPQIGAVSPATLGPGTTAIISGENFDTNPADLDVTIAGLTVPVTAAAATQLTVQLPAFVPCQPTQNVTVSVTGAGGTATRAHPLQVARQRSVAVGEVLLLTGLDLRCNELPATPARYALAVINTSGAPGATVGFELRGLGGGAAASAAPAVAAPLLTWSSAGGAAAGLVNPLRQAAAVMHGRDHMRWLEQERALVRKLGSPRQARRAAQMRLAAARAQGVASTGSQLAAAGVPLEVGATTTLKIRTSDNNCTESKPVPARVVHVGTRSVILESADAPLAATMDADYVTLGTEYDNTMHGVLVEHFGDPLAYDASTDNNGKIVMLFTKAVNDRAPNLLGFVTVCDFFPPSTAGATASNQAEIFYARVPTSTEDNRRNINTRVGWMHIMRGTLIHEAKHIAAYAERFQTPVEVIDLEESWLEEATAQAAIEFWGRATYYAGKATWKGNATYANTMHCDLGIPDRGCGDQPSIISDHFVFLFGYYENVETKSYFSPASLDNNVYGSGWLLLRWAADHHATNEAAFFRAVTTSYNVTGLRNIEARIGRDFASFHPDFMLALYADDAPGLSPAAGARYTIPSWHMRDMFLGMSGDFTRGGEAIPAFPLRMRVASFGAFAADVGALLGGGAAYVELSGTPTAPQVLDLRSPGGGPVPESSTLRLAILRVE
jgi:hypothetical protein